MLLLSGRRRTLSISFLLAFSCGTSGILLFGWCIGATIERERLFPDSILASALFHHRNRLLSLGCSWVWHVILAQVLLLFALLQKDSRCLFLAHCHSHCHGIVLRVAAWLGLLKFHELHLLFHQKFLLRCNFGQLSLQHDLLLWHCHPAVLMRQMWGCLPGRNEGAPLFGHIGQLLVLLVLLFLLLVVELFEKVADILEVLERFPGVLVAAVAFPLDKVVGLLADFALVDDTFDRVDVVVGAGLVLVRFLTVGRRKFGIGLLQMHMLFVLGYVGHHFIHILVSEVDIMSCLLTSCSLLLFHHYYYYFIRIAEYLLSVSILWFLGLSVPRDSSVLSGGFRRAILYFN